MKTVNIVLRAFKGPLRGQDTIGVDSGAWACYQRGIPMVVACGDFDSITLEQLQAIKEDTAIIKLSPQKDVTDFEHALSLVQDYDRIYVYGALGQRLDHELVNIELLKRDARIHFVDAYQEAYLMETGVFTIDTPFKYVSFMVVKPTVITLKGFKYPLTHKTVSSTDLFLTSNECISDRPEVIIHSGCVLFIGIHDEKA